jgi:hypothetical protein
MTQKLNEKSAKTNRRVEAAKNINVPHLDNWPLIINRKRQYPGLEWQRWTYPDDTKPRHTFVDDWRLETVWRDPYYQVDRVILARWAMTPDFTIETYHSYYFTAWQIYRSRLIGAYWQQHLIHVVPVLQWGNPDFLELTLAGLRHCQIVAVRSPTRESEREWFKVAERLNQALPGRLVLHFGKKDGLSVWDNALHLRLDPDQRKRKTAM